jgi:O-antigen/teichoic acid export membrane protein
MKRGIVLNLASNILFFVCGYAIHFFLGNTMPAAEYGIVGTIMTVLDFEYMFLSNGARQSIAKEISFRHYNVRDVILKSIGFQLILITFFFLLNFVGAPLFGKVLNDGSLVFYFRIAAFLVPANGLFVILLGINDGLQHFSLGAILNTLYPVAKLSVIPLIIFIFHDTPVLGVEIGYLGALIVSIAVGLILIFPYRHELADDSNKTIPFHIVVRNTLSFSIFFIMVSLILSIDTLVVKAVVTPSSMTGYYTGAVNLGKIPYYLVYAFCTIALPVVAKAMGQGDSKGAVRKIHDFILVIVSAILPIPVIVSATSPALLSAFYQNSYAIASSALSCLAFSSLFMGITVLLNMALSSFSPNKFSDLLSLASMIIVVPIFIVSAQLGGINAISCASMICTFITMIISAIVLMKAAGRGILSRQIIIIIGCNCILWGLLKTVSQHLEASNIIQLAGFYCFIYLLFVALLLILKLLPDPRKLLD